MPGDRAAARLSAKGAAKRLDGDLQLNRSKNTAAKEAYESKQDLAWAASMAEHYEIGKSRHSFVEALFTSAVELKKFIEGHTGLEPMTKFKSIVCKDDFFGLMRRRSARMRPTRRS